MSEEELINQAKIQGATHYAKHLNLAAFWRKGLNGLEIAEVQNGQLGPWQRDWRDYPPESAVRL